MSEAKTLIEQAEMFHASFEEHYKSGGKVSNFLVEAMQMIAAMRCYLEDLESGVVDLGTELVSKADVIAVLLDLNNAYYSFFARIDDPEVASKIADTWHKRLRKYKKIVLNDAIENILSTPNDYHRAPNLNDVIVECERICYFDKYRKKDI